MARTKGAKDKKPRKKQATTSKAKAPKKQNSLTIARATRKKTRVNSLNVERA